VAHLDIITIIIEDITTIIMDSKLSLLNLNGNGNVYFK